MRTPGRRATETDDESSSTAIVVVGVAVEQGDVRDHLRKARSSAVAAITSDRRSPSRRHGLAGVVPPVRIDTLSTTTAGLVSVATRQISPPSTFRIELGGGRHFTLLLPDTDANPDRLTRLSGVVYFSAPKTRNDLHDSTPFEVVIP